MSNFIFLSFLYKQTSPFSYVACRKRHLFYTVQQRKSEMSECRLDQVSEKAFHSFYRIPKSLSILSIGHQKPFTMKLKPFKVC